VRLPWFALTHACAAAAIALTAMPRPLAQQVPAFRCGIDLVNVGVTVTDRAGGLVADLGPADFEIQEDGRTQTISYFLAGDPVAGAAPNLHVGVLLDVSESMAGEIGFVRTAAIKFLNGLERAADMTVVDFDTEVRVARFSQDDFPRLVERIRRQKVSGLTALYDAIGVYLDGAAGQDGRTIMLLYTDGGDTRSTLTLRELMELLKASDATVYAIGSLAHQSLSGRLPQERVLRQIAEVTGGQAFFPTDVKELDKVYDQVLAELRAQYTIGYLSTNGTRDGAWRKVDVKLNKPGARGLRIRARKGYFAPYKP
jgi:Ca-activated chloride channel family protein